MLAEELEEFVAFTSQGVTRSDLVELAGVERAFDGGVVSAESIDGDGGGKLELKEWFEQRFDVRVGGCGNVNSPVH